MTPGLNFASSEFVQFFYHIINTDTCIFTVDITCCSLHIAPGLKGHDFKAFSCSIDSFFKIIFKNSPLPPDPFIPQEKDDHQFFIMWPSGETHLSILSESLGHLN